MERESSRAYERYQKWGVRAEEVLQAAHIADGGEAVDGHCGAAPDVYGEQHVSEREAATDEAHEVLVV